MTGAPVDVTDFKRTYREQSQGRFPRELPVYFQKEYDLRYGENPNQHAAAYRVEDPSVQRIRDILTGEKSVPVLTNIRTIREAKGGLSATNLMDVTKAMQLVGYFSKPAVAVMKHTKPSGFAVQHGGNELAAIYTAARDADARSAFGSVVVSNVPVDRAAAEAIASTFVEVVAAPEYGEGATDILEGRKNLRIALFSNLDKMPRFKGDDTRGCYEIKVLPSGRAIIQDPYLTSIRGPEDLAIRPLVRAKEREHYVERTPTGWELDDLLTAWYVNLVLPSNGVVIVKDGATVAVGSGQQERVGAVEQAITKALQKAMDREGITYDPIAMQDVEELNVLMHHLKHGLTVDSAKIERAARPWKHLSTNPLEQAVLSSDGFFPFRDSIDLLAQYGVSAVIQPGGSERDYEVIDAVNEHKMAMPFTLERCFVH